MSTYFKRPASLTTLVTFLQPKFFLFFIEVCLHKFFYFYLFFFTFFPFIFISCRLITLQYYSGFCHILTWIGHGFTCIPHPDPPSHLPLYVIPLGLPSAPGPSTCLMHPAWAGDLFQDLVTKWQCL